MCSPSIFPHLFKEIFHQGTIFVYFSDSSGMKPGGGVEGAWSRAAELIQEFRIRKLSVHR